MLVNFFFHDDLPRNKLREDGKFITIFGKIQNYTKFTIFIYYALWVWLSLCDENKRSFYRSLYLMTGNKLKNAKNISVADAIFSVIGTK